MGEEEYEVESILQAKVVKQRKQLMWQFRVRWKGYTPDDDTWEPMESFEGSQDIMNNFWERASTGGRNYLDLNLFKAGEEFLPKGPPRRKKRQSLSTPYANPVTSAINHEQPSDGASPSEKRKRSQSPQLEPSTRPQKRAREPLRNGSSSQSAQFRNYDPGFQDKSESKQARNSQRTTKRTSSPEIVPDSDEETEHTLTIQDPPPKPILTARPAASSITTSRLLKNLHRDRPDQLVEPRLGTEKNAAANVNGVSNEDLNPLLLPIADKERATDIPSHKAKTTSPLVRQADDAGITHIEGAINTKARLMQQTKQESTKKSLQASRPRPGPGRSSAGMIQKNRSSLLTAEKGVLKTVRGKYTRSKQVLETGESSEPQGVVVDNVQQEHANGALSSAPDQAVEPVSGSELLQLATDETTLQDTDMLPAFEEATAVPDPLPLGQEPSTSIPLPDPALSSRSKFLPFGALPELRTIGNHVERASNEKASAFIQDMLFAGNLSSSWNRTIFEKPNTSSVLHLAVDHSRSIPMRLKSLDSTAQGAQKWGSITQRNPNAPLGKFYSANNAHLIMNTLRTCDTTASVDVDPTATAEQVALFQQFQDRLKAGYLFMAMAGPDVLAFCFSRSVDIASKLNIPARQREDDGVLVARVTIESYTEYADATIFSEAW